MRPGSALTLIVALLVAATGLTAARAEAGQGAYLRQGGTETALVMNGFSATLLPDPAHPEVVTSVIADFPALREPNITLTEPLTVLRFDEPMTSVTAVHARGTVATSAPTTQIDPTHWSIDLSGARAGGAVLTVASTGAPNARYAATYNRYGATILPAAPAGAVLRLCGDVNLGAAVAHWIRARGTTCRNAREIAHALLRRSHDARIRGYTCTFQAPANPQPRSVCRTPGRTITFLIPRGSTGLTAIRESP